MTVQGCSVISHSTCYIRSWNDSSHCNSFPHSPCYKILVWIETGVASSNWSNTHKESCSISCFVIKGILLVRFLGMSEGISEEAFHCFPKIFAMLPVSAHALLSCWTWFCMITVEGPWKLIQICLTLCSSFVIVLYDFTFRVTTKDHIKLEVALYILRYR